MSVPVSQELLDVVDADDRVVDVRPRGEVHRLGLMHRSAHILLFNGKGELFIQKRSMSKDSNPGLWDSSAAGHVDSGEDYLDCAIRELGEELGIYQACPGPPILWVHRLDRNLLNLRPLLYPSSRNAQELVFLGHDACQTST